MKRIRLVPIIALFTLFISCGILGTVNSQNRSEIELSAHFDGYWSKWQICYGVSVKGNYGGFIIYDDKDGPWYPLFKFTIDNFSIPDKKIRKRHLKDKEWYEYKGTVEYYICDDHLSAYSLFKSKSGPCFVNETLTKDVGRPVKKVVSRATIKISPYKDYPTCYNIWYDNVGLAIDLNKIKFQTK